MDRASTHIPKGRASFLKSARFPVECEAEEWAGAARAGSAAEPLGHPDAIKLAAYWGLLSISIILLRILCWPIAVWPSAVSHMLLEVCSVLIIAGIVHCLWVQYCVSAERWILLATIAFGGLMLGDAAYAVALAAGSAGFAGVSKAGLPYCLAWRVAAGCLLIMAARSHAVEDRQESCRAGLRSIIGALAFSLFIAFIALELVKSWPRMQSALPAALTAILYSIGRAVSSPITIHAISLAALGTAFVLFARRYFRNEDAFSEGITKYLLLASAAEVASLTSAAEYDMIWWVSHVLATCALLELVTHLWTEFAASYADAYARIEHMEVVHHVSSHLSNTLDLSVVLRTLVSDAADMLSARYASAMLADEKDEHLITAATYGLPKVALRRGRPHSTQESRYADFSSSHTARAFRERRVCVVDDVYTDVEFIPWRVLAHCDGYTVSVPLVYHEVALGVLNLFFDRHVPLNDERIRLFQTLASAGAVAIMNAHLYSKSQHGKAGEDGLRFRLAS